MLQVARLREAIIRIRVRLESAPVDNAAVEACTVELSIVGSAIAEEIEAAFALVSSAEASAA